MYFFHLQIFKRFIKDKSFFASIIEYEMTLISEIH